MRAGRLALWMAASLIALIALFPFYWAVVTSLETGSALFSVDYLPETAHWENYLAVFTEQNFGRNLLNSALVAGSTVAISLALGLFAAYALARRRFRGRRAALYLFLAVAMFPQVAVLTGLFELITALGLYNRWPGLALAYLLFTLPFTVWLLTAFLAEVPRELEEAAAIDGAGPLTLVVRVLLPLVAPGAATAALLSFIVAWNEFLFALTFTLTDQARTVPVAIALITGASQYELPWGRVMAASVIVTVPLIVLTLVCQRRIVSGLTAGALKG